MAKPDNHKYSDLVIMGLRNAQSEMIQVTLEMSKERTRITDCSVYSFYRNVFGSMIACSTGLDPNYLNKANKEYRVEQI